MTGILGEKEYLKSIKIQVRFSFEQDYVMFIQGLGPLTTSLLVKKSNLTLFLLSLFLGKKVEALTDHVINVEI